MSEFKFLYSLVLDTFSHSLLRKKSKSQPPCFYFGLYFGIFSIKSLRCGPLSSDNAGN